MIKINKNIFTQAMAIEKFREINRRDRDDMYP